MKLDDIRISLGYMTDDIYIGTLNKGSSMYRNKRCITSDFIRCVMEWTPPGTIRGVVDNDGNQYEIEVRKIDATKNTGER